jgi:hypothetical protein
MSSNIYGSPNGNSILIGDPLPGLDETINAFAFNNVIFAMGADDQINTGSGNATVHLNGNGSPPATFVGVTDTVNVGGAFNLVQTEGGGHVGSTLTVQGGTGENTTKLANTNGNNNVSLQGFFNKITVNSDATNTIFSGAGNSSVDAGKSGDGNFGFTTSVIDAGQHNTVIGGDQNFTISGGQGFDLIMIGNGDNTITEAGVQDKMSVGGGNNVIKDLGGRATITVGPANATDPDNTDVITLAGTNNTVTGKSDQDFTINVTNGGAGKFTLGDGNNILNTSGNNNTIVMGTSDEPGGDMVVANGSSNSIKLGNANNNVTANGASDTINLGNGANAVVANGNNDAITAGNGANTVVSNGNTDTITLGNGGNALTSNGNTDTITVGNGNNKIGADGNNDTITLGSGKNTVSAKGDSDTITASKGTESIALGSNGVVTLNATGTGTTIDSIGAQNSIVLNSDANVNVADELSGGQLNVTINASAGNSGTIVLTGFADDGDTNGLIDLQGFGLTNISQLNATSDGNGGTLIHLGTGSLDLAFATIHAQNFAFS